MGRVVALVPDLMFGSRVRELLEGAGHEVRLTAQVADAADAAPGADAIVVDLASGIGDAALKLAEADAFTLAVYSHVEADVRARAEAAGFDAVVPRSRFVREGAGLLEVAG
jgi:nucleoside-diphosphate-sugar epimerase